MFHHFPVTISHLRLAAAAHGALSAFHGAAAAMKALHGLGVGLRHAARRCTAEAVARRLCRGAWGGPWGLSGVQNGEKNVGKNG